MNIIPTHHLSSRFGKFTQPKRQLHIFFVQVCATQSSSRGRASIFSLMSRNTEKATNYVSLEQANSYCILYYIVVASLAAVYKVEGAEKVRAGC
jgi:hypothetical protein